jgi:hypothetical protein
VPFNVDLHGTNRGYVRPKLPQELIESRPWHGDRSLRGCESIHNSVAGHIRCCIFKLDGSAFVGEGFGEDLELEVIDAQTFPSPLDCSGVGLKQDRMLHLIGNQKAHQSDIGADVNKRPAVQMAAQKAKGALFGEE